MNKFLLMSLMLGGMSSGFSTPTRAVERKNPSPKAKPPMPCLRHEGPIPNGCKLEKKTLQFKKEEVTLSIEVDLVYSVQRGRERKINLYTNQIQLFLSQYTLQELLNRNDGFCVQ